MLRYVQHLTSLEILVTVSVALIGLIPDSLYLSNDCLVREGCVACQVIVWGGVGAADT